MPYLLCRPQFKRGLALVKWILNTFKKCKRTKALPVKEKFRKELLIPLPSHVMAVAAALVTHCRISLPSVNHPPHKHAIETRITQSSSLP